MKTPITASSKTDCNDQNLLFQELGRRKVVADFSGGTLSSDGGVLLLRQVDANLGLTMALAECFEDRYDSAVWYKMMEPRLRKRVPDRDERMEILKNVFCEANRAGEVKIPPGLVMALIDVESGFNRYAVSYAGAVGLMQVMPFWPENLGMRRHQLIKSPENIRMGCAIFRFYLKREGNNVTRALARYNGSTGHRGYSDKVIAQWSRWNGADDLGYPRAGGAR